MKINIILPFLTLTPGGGIKVMYEYAQRLSLKGHNVCIYHSTKTLHSTKITKSKLRIVKRFYKDKILGREIVYPKWFTFNPEIKVQNIPYVANFWIRDADICFSTWWATAIEVSMLNDNKGVKVNLIQDIETIMTDYPDMVYESYKLPSQHIVISNFIKDTVSKYTKAPLPLLLNGLDNSKYKIEKPIESRNKQSVIMLFSNHIRKGSQYGIEALCNLKEIFPNLEVTLFSAEAANDIPDLPKWINLKLNPNNLIDLYNQAAIFLSPSIQEGLALPPMEAMACGCACVCTDIGGHQYAINEENALLIEPKSIDSIFEKIKFLLENDSYRIEIAKKGNASIQEYKWENAVDQLEEMFDQFRSKA